MLWSALQLVNQINIIFFLLSRPFQNAKAPEENDKQVTSFLLSSL